MNNERVHKIKQLIESKNLIEALAEIDKALQQNIDLSIAEEQAYIELLYKLKADAESGVVDNVCNELNTVDTMRSTNSSVTVKVVSNSDYSSLAKATNHVGARKYIPIHQTPHDGFIYIVYTQSPDEDFSTLKGFPATNRLKALGIGQHFDSQLPDNRVAYTIMGLNNSASGDGFAVAQGLNQVIKNLYDDDHESIGVVIDFDEVTSKQNMKKLYFHMILLVTLYKIVQCSNQAIHPYFSFLFRRDADLEEFQKVLLSFRKEEKVPFVRPTDRKEQSIQLAERCLTKNQKFTDTLKSTLCVIDEENIPILLGGESGVGKSFLAKVIHEFSNRGSKPFQEINCGALNEEKLDSRLWGWKKGAFTGAHKDHAGMIERAEGGTLFLDEIDLASQGVRHSLLTFIETKEYEILGDDKTTKGDVRLIFGSNKDLKSYVNKGKMEGDFYSRISGRVIQIPPLRERIEDLDLMIDFFLARQNKKKDSFITIDEEGRDYLKSYSWPWNVRELEKTIINCFFDAYENKETVLTKEIIEKHPFENFTATRLEDYENLEELIKAFLNNWESDNGSFLDEVLAPITAKVYFDECFRNMPREEKWKNSSKLLGISGVNHNTSTLKKTYDKYEFVKEKLGLT